MNAVPGKAVKLNPPAEEVALFFAQMLDHEYTMKEVFRNNFFRDWRKVNCSYICKPSSVLNRLSVVYMKKNMTHFNPKRVYFLCEGRGSLLDAQDLILSFWYFTASSKSFDRHINKHNRRPKIMLLCLNQK